MQKNQKSQNLRIIPIGGCEEVGRNMTIFEYGKDIIILDMGIQFPEENMPGINYVIPNIKYLKGKEKNIRAVIFSHGHLDHIGAAPILLEKLGNPLIVGRPLTMELIKHRQEDYIHGSSKRLKTLYIKTLKDNIKLGVFDVSFFQVDHAIIDAVGLILKTPSVTVIHPGDWTMEHDPIGRKKLRYDYLAKLRRPTILMLESLGSMNSTEPITEKQMVDNLQKLINGAPGRIIIATFSSQLERIKQILEHACKINKKVALDGYSMKNNVEIAKKLGYIKAYKKTMIPINKASDYSDNKVIIICTGAQGEENAVLPRIVRGDHRFVKIRKKDTIVFSSSVIPGNERTIQRLKDGLYRLSDHIVHSEIMDVHTSGHSNIQNIKTIINQIKPNYFIPVYANHSFLKEAAKIAYGLGISKSKIIVPDNGSVIIASQKEVKMINEKVPANYVFVDGLGIGDVGEIVLKDRQNLAKDGMFVIAVVINGKTGKVVGSPDIISRGFVYMRESKELLGETRKKVIKIVNGAVRNGAGANSPRPNFAYIKNEIRDKISNFLYSKTERMPMVLPVVIEV